MKIKNPLFERVFLFKQIYTKTSNGDNVLCKVIENRLPSISLHINGVLLFRIKNANDFRAFS